MTEQGDPGVYQDTVKAHAASKQGKHLFGPHKPDAMNEPEKILSEYKAPVKKKKPKKK